MLLVLVDGAPSLTEDIAMVIYDFVMTEGLMGFFSLDNSLPLLQV